MTALSPAIALPAWAVANLWEWEGHGPPHPIVGYDEHWTPPEARDEFQSAVMATLREEGLAHDGVLVDELRDALWVLANAEHECYGRMFDRTGTDRRVLVAAADGRAVRFTRDDRMATLEFTPADTIAESCVQPLPDVPPARFQTLSVRESDYRPSADEMTVVVQPSATRLRELTSGTRTGMHEFIVATRAGGSRVSSRPMTVLDLVERGRVACYYTTPGNDVPHIACVPGDPANLVSALGVIRAELSKPEGTR